MEALGNTFTAELDGTCTDRATFNDEFSSGDGKLEPARPRTARVYIQNSASPLNQWPM